MYGKPLTQQKLVHAEILRNCWPKDYILLQIGILANQVSTVLGINPLI
jgi:hypothetical protein